MGGMNLSKVHDPEVGRTTPALLRSFITAVERGWRHGRRQLHNID